MNQLTRSVIEVERKFKPHRALADFITANTLFPCFGRVRHLGRRVFEDVYCDHNGLLASQGTWVRLRDGEFQAKHRLRGDFIKSSFLERKGRNDVWKLLIETPRAAQKAAEGRTLADALKLDHRTLGLTEFARYKTARETWLVDEYFRVVLDETDFGHRVGEVELEQTVEGGDIDEGQMQELMMQMGAEIEAFMKRHKWAFPQEEPVGKLSAYFERTQTKRVWDQCDAPIAF